VRMKALVAAQAALTVRDCHDEGPVMMSRVDFRGFLRIEISAFKR
jgi:hypothetical protein